MAGDFDPDGFLADAPAPEAPVFDPDAFLAKPISDAPAPKLSIIQGGKPVNVPDTSAVQPEDQAWHDRETAIAARDATRAAENAQLSDGYKASLEAEKGSGSRQAAINELASRFGVPTTVVAPNLRQWQDALKAAEFDPDKLRADHPEVARALLDHPEIHTVETTKELGTLASALHKAQDLFEDVTTDPAVQDLTTLFTAGAIGPDDTAPKSGSPEEAAQHAADLLTRPSQRAKRDAPITSTEVDDATAAYVRAHPALAPFGRLDENWKQNHVAGMSAELAMRLLANDDSQSDSSPDVFKSTSNQRAIDELRGKLLDAKLSAGSPRAFGPAGDGFVADALTGAASSAYGLGGGLTPSGTLPDSPLLGTAMMGAEAPAAAVAWRVPGAKYVLGGALARGTFNLELGSTFDQSVDWKDDQGNPIPEKTRAAGAAVYAALATAQEFAELGLLHGLGEAAAGVEATSIAGGGFKATFKRAMKSAEFRNLVLQAGKSTLGEMSEEAGQSLTQAALTWLTKSVAQGEWSQQGLNQKDAEDALQAFAQAGPYSLLQAGAGAAIGRASASRHLHDNLTGNQVAKTIAEHEGETQAQAPSAVAALIEDATAKSGQPTTHLYVDPEVLATSRLFQDEKQASIDDLLGPDGQRKLDEALATGGKVEVALPLYLQKWAGTPLAKETAEDTTVRPAGLTTRELKEHPELVTAQAAAFVAEAEVEKKKAAAETKRFVAMDEAVAAAGVKGLDKAKASASVNLWRAIDRQVRSYNPELADQIFEESRIQLATAGKLDESMLQGGPSPLELRAQVEDPAVHARDVNIDRLTNLRTYDAFNAAPKTPGKQVIAVTLATIKPINDAENGGHDTANVILRHLAPIARAADATAARKGTTFYLEGDKATMEATREAMRNALPPGMAIEAGIGADSEAAAKALDKTVTEKRASGDLPKLRTETKFDLKTLPQVEQQLATTPLGDPNISQEMIDAAAETSPEDRLKAYHDKVNPNVLNELGFDLTGPAEHVGAVDIKGLKADFNEAFAGAEEGSGKWAGDLAIAHIMNVAVKLNGHDVNFAHLSGDEFALKHDDKAKVEEFLADLRAELLANPVKVKWGSVTVFVPVQIRFGIGEKTYGSADRLLNAAKSREAGPDGTGPTAAVVARGVRKASADASTPAATAARAARANRRGSKSEALPGDRGAAGRGGRELTLYEQSPMPQEAIDAQRAEIAAMRNKVKQAWAGKQLDFILGKGERPKNGGLSQRIRDEVSNDLMNAGFPDPELKFDLDGTVGRPTADGANHRKVSTDKTRSVVERIAFQQQIKGNGSGGGTGGSSLYQNEEPKNLVVQHNLTAENLLHADKMGGLAAPSIAISRKEHPLSGFGGITLIAPKEVIDPKGGTPVFDADVYSPRYPEIGYTVDKKKDLALHLWLKPFAAKTGTYLEDFTNQLREKGVEAALTRNMEGAFGLAWLESIGVKVSEESLQHQPGVGSRAQRLRYAVEEEIRHRGAEAYEKFVREKVEPIVEKSHITQYTKTGNLRRIPHTLENVLKAVTRKLRGGEGFNYGLGDARAAGAKKFKSIEQIQKARDQISSKAEFDKLKAENDQRWSDLVQRLAPYVEAPASPGDQLTSALAAAYKKGAKLEAVLADHGFTKIPADLLHEFGDFAADLIAMPTEYFEAKPQRVVALSEFKAAVVPENTPEEVLAVLKKHGIAVTTYATGLVENGHQLAVEKAAEAAGLLFAGPTDNPRGSVQHIRDGVRDIFKIALNPTADLSTFLHESGHVFLEIFADLAARPDAPEQVKADFAEAQKFMGAPVGPATRDANGWSFTRAQHEKFADAFLIYLREGKAPSQALASTFKKFSKWLLGIYKTVSQLGAPLSPEIKGVFDRLLATDEEIADTKRAMGAPLFGSLAEALAAGLSPERYAEYLDDQEKATSHAERLAKLQAKKELLREKTKQWKDELAAHRKDAEAEFDALPAAKAKAALLGEGSLAAAAHQALAGDNTLKVPLDRAAVEAAVGQAAARKFRLVKEGGFSPDDVSAGYGFGTGAEMLKAIEVLPSKAEWAAKRADFLMREANPGLIEDHAQLADLVGKGLHGDETERWLLKEIAAITAKAPNGFAGRVPVESIQLSAKLMVNATTVAKLKPAAALAAERKAANLAVKLLAKKDFGAVLVQKQKQLLNMYLYRELQAAKDLTDRAARKIANTSDDIRAELGKADPVFRDVHDAIAQAVGLESRFTDNGQLKPAGLGIDELVAHLAADGQEPEFDVAAIRALISTPKPWAKLTFLAAKTVSDAITNIRHLARDEQSIMLEGKRVAKFTYWKEVEERAAAVRKRVPAEPARREDKSLGEKARALARGASSLLQSVEVWTHMLDGGPEGPARRLLVDSRRAGPRTVEARLTTEVLHKIRDLAKSLPPETLARKNDLMPELSALLPETHDLFVARHKRSVLYTLFLNSGNDGNNQRRRDGNGWTDANVQKALNLLTPGEAKFLQGILDVVESLGPDLAAAYEARTGLKMERVTATPITVNGETFRGGYYPLRADSGKSAAGRAMEINDIKDLFPSNHSPVTAMGAAKSRLATAGYPIDFSWEVLPAHLAQVIHTIAYDEWIRQAGKAILKPRVELDGFPSFSQTTQKYLGPEREAELKKLLQDIACGRADSAANGLNSTLKMLGSGASSLVARQAMSLNFPSLMRHLFDTWTTVFDPAQLSPLRVANAYRQLWNPKTWDAPEFKLSKSLEYHRVSHHDNLRKELSAIGTGTKLGEWNDKALKVAFAAHEFVHSYTARVAFKAAYDQGMAEGKTQAEAVKLADDVIDRNFPNGDIAEKPPLLRTKFGLGSMAMFYGYASKIHSLRSMGLDDAVRAWSPPDGPSRKFDATVRAAGVTVGLGVIGALGMFLAGKGPPKKGDSEEDIDTAAEWAAEEVLLSPLDDVWAVGPMTKKFLTGHKVNATSAPELEWLSAMYQRIQKAMKSTDSEQEWSNYEIAKSALATLLSMMGASGAAERTTRGLDAVDDSAGPVDAAGQVFYGHRKKQNHTPASLLSGFLDQ